MLILDLMLPKVSGVDILARVKDCQMPIIVVTALDDLSSRSSVFRWGQTIILQNHLTAWTFLARGWERCCAGQAPPHVPSMSGISAWTGPAPCA